MSGKSPAGPLIHEHKVIERMISSLGGTLSKLEETRSIDPVYIDTVVDFIRTYADRCHHGKEEDILFRDLANKPLSGPVAAMMQELIEDHVFAAFREGCEAYVVKGQMGEKLLDAVVQLGLLKVAKVQKDYVLD